MNSVGMPSVERVRGTCRPDAPAGGNAPGTSLRGWLDHLQRSRSAGDRARGRGLRFELAAIAKRLDGQQGDVLSTTLRATRCSVISGLVSDRGWIAEAMGVGEDRLLEDSSTRRSSRCLGGRSTAPAQEVVHRELDLARLLPHADP